jgi:aminomethyltransferase
MLVINASNTEKDFSWMKEKNRFGVKLENLSDEYSLLALQGPNSKKILQKITETNLDDLDYYHFKKGKTADTDMIISRTGYTGELGYELYFTGDVPEAEKIWNKIFEAGKEYDIAPAGLAARDSLRLEMGFCLYGNDIDQDTNPLEAGLGWITKLSKGNFIGKDALLRIRSSGLKRKLSALVSDEKAFPRHGYQIKTNGDIIGTITSGTVSPVLEKPIALAYINKEFSEPGSKVNILIREKEIPAEVVKLPFVKK